MAQPKLQQEPTMEEILASIRRIIDSGEEMARPSHPARERTSYQAREAERGRDQAPEETESREDYLEPPQASHDPEPLSDSGFISRRPAFEFDDNSYPPEADDSAAAQKPTAAPQGFAPVEAPLAAVEEQETHSAYEPEAVYPGTIGEVAQQLREAGNGLDAGDASARVAASADEAREDGLLSSGSEQRIGNALDQLSDALDREGARRIEEIVVGELRPLLREWIDEHMPSIVEEMVAKEIERMRNAKR